MYVYDLPPAETYSPVARTAQTRMSASICSLTNPGFTARGRMSRKGQSILSSMKSKHSGSDEKRYSSTSIGCASGFTIGSSWTIFKAPYHLLLSSLFHHRFEFDVSLVEAQRRMMDVSVKNNKMFITRNRKDIGMVGNATCVRQAVFIPDA